MLSIRFVSRTKKPVTSAPADSPRRKFFAGDPRDFVDQLPLLLGRLPFAGAEHDPQARLAVLIGVGDAGRP